MTEDIDWGLVKKLAEEKTKMDHQLKLVQDMAKLQAAMTSAKASMQDKIDAMKDAEAVETRRRVAKNQTHGTSDMDKIEMKKWFRSDKRAPWWW